MKKILRSAINQLGFDLIRTKRSPNLLKDDEIAFLHIGKNAGTQVMNVAVKLKDYGINIHKFGHNTKLSQLPHGAKYFFSVRKPEARFFSGFYSRKRKGQPRIYSEWSKHEAVAFSLFEHANDLAENLFSEDHIGREARMAIKSISHTGKQQIDWFQRCGFIDQQPPLTIIRQEKFVSDMQRLLNLLNLDVDVTTMITKDNISAHRNDYTDVPPLSDLAIKNLREWYIQDCYFYEMCEDFLQREFDHL
ncbi:sulfotransferase family 2 domain-containing protein [Candidatus Pelagibacter sp.]|nr:sulfotransferase family 2 domain-containing protein [Candidatus Pelagibacter sp.]